MDSALHILSGCQCPAIRNMVTERHNIANRMILKVVSKGCYGSNLIHMDVGIADRLAQHDLHITEQVSNRVIPPYLFDPSVPDRARRTSSRPDAILVTPCPTYPNRPPNPPSHRVLRSIRCNEEERSSTTPARQFCESNIQKRHIHLIEIKYCKDTMPGAQREASQQRHSELCKQLQGAEITLHTILLACSLRAFAKSFDDHYYSNIVAFSTTGLAAARRECLGQTQRPDQLQVRVTSGTRHPWHKARDKRNNAKPQWKVEQKVK
eukprot:1143082-Pelagomonas_calceolata.AAC.3